MYVHRFHETDAEHGDRVGGKGANLGLLTRKGLRVPPGFCVDVSAYRQFVTGNGLALEIERWLDQVSLGDIQALNARTSNLKALFLDAPVSAEFRNQVSDAYSRLSRDSGAAELPVAVRSSSTAEDMRQASFAGQYDSYMNVRGEDDLIDHIKRCWASLWNPEAIHYRHSNGIDQFDVAMAVVVQQMVRSKASGVLFSVNPVSGDLTEMVVNASFGLGEGVVEGSVEVDSFVLDRETAAVKHRSVQVKRRLIEYAVGSGTQAADVPIERQQEPSLTDAQLRELHGLAVSIEEIYGAPPRHRVEP